jgi:tRNA threonylcarbamoyladenosine biosynthesis protein TsaB
VAVGIGDKILAESRNDLMYGQAETLFPMIDVCMTEARQVPAAIGLIAVTVGPGSFTGIRVGLAAARGVALATGARLVGVTSFEAVAVEAARNHCSDAGSLLIALESRREDLYVQFFDLRGGALCEPSAIAPSALPKMAEEVAGERPLLIAGDAARRAAAVLVRHPHTILSSSPPDAVGALRVGLRRSRTGKKTGAALPFYLRPPDAAPSGGTSMQGLPRK